jgi:hypothetical protein
MAYVERQNLFAAHRSRRFTRPTNGFSKKLDNHVAAVALYLAHNNPCRVHEALKMDASEGYLRCRRGRYRLAVLACFEG